MPIVKQDNFQSLYLNKNKDKNINSAKVRNYHKFRLLQFQKNTKIIKKMNFKRNKEIFNFLKKSANNKNIQIKGQKILKRKKTKFITKTKTVKHKKNT